MCVCVRVYSVCVCVYSVCVCSVCVCVCVCVHVHVCVCSLTDLNSNFPCTTSLPVTGIGGGRGWLASTKSWAGARGWGWGAAGCPPNDPAPPMCNEPGLGACVGFRQV